jgi:hypothetical protein
MKIIFLNRHKERDVMNKVRFAFIPVLAWVALGGAVFAEGKFRFDMTPTCNASLEFGNIIKGHDKNVGGLNNVWMEKAIIGFGVQTVFSPVDTFRAAAEMKMFNEYPRYELGASRRLYHYPYVREAQVIRTFISKDRVRVMGGIGYYPYKYNANARNLGEYLFRSTAYPQTLSTEFDYPFARLLGGYVKTALFDQVRCDVLIASNQEYMAIHDINAAILGTWNPGRVFEIGCAVSYGSILSADSNATTPKNDISSAYIDTVNGKPDTQYYTFASTKIMARMSFDPKVLFTGDGFGGFLGEHDLRLYTEAALLGTENYPRAFKSPVWYMNPLQRVPVMFGLTWPTNPLLTWISPVVPAGLSYVLDANHTVSKADMVRLSAAGGAGAAVGAGLWYLEKKVANKFRFDEISIEAQWWGNPYANSQQGIVMDGLPLPFASGTTVIQDSLIYKSDNWKWSIYAKKTFAGHYNLMIQAASDHMRTFALDWSRQDWEESLRGPSNWCYIVKFGVLL